MSWGWVSFDRRCIASAARWWIGGCLVLLGLVSCSRPPDHPPVFPTRGQVLYEGRPASGAVVVLHSPGGTAHASRPRGQADANGQFELTTYRAGDGAPAGAYVVTVEWRRAEDHPEQGANVLPPAYSDPSTSPLRATVLPEKNPEKNGALVLQLTARS